MPGHGLGSWPWGSEPWPAQGSSRKQPCSRAQGPGLSQCHQTKEASGQQRMPVSSHGGQCSNVVRLLPHAWGTVTLNYSASASGDRQTSSVCWEDIRQWLQLSGLSWERRCWSRTVWLPVAAQAPTDLVTPGIVKPPRELVKETISWCLRPKGDNTQKDLKQEVARVCHILGCWTLGLQHINSGGVAIQLKTNPSTEF